MSNFAFALLDQGAKPYTILLDPFEKLVVYGPDGEGIWRSEAYFGGGLTFMMNKELNVRDIGDIGKRIYFPSPIFLTDLDKDGQQEVVICQNHSPTLRVTGYLRDFSNGRVLFLTWDGVGLSTRWTSGKLPGAVVGYRVADVDQDGLPELVVAAVSGVGLTLKSTRSQVVVYDLK